jgi:hypothetical protein
MSKKRDAGSGWSACQNMPVPPILDEGSDAPTIAPDANAGESERVLCMSCGKSVSSPVPVGTVVRAWVECPECIEKAEASPRLSTIWSVFLRAEVDRLKKLINTPEILDFVKAVQIEAVHQRERWGTEQDEGKTAADWFWLLGYLAGKALHSDKVGDHEKLLHHIITTAAACANWHAQVLGKCDMRPGIETPASEK